MADYPGVLLPTSSVVISGRSRLSGRLGQVTNALLFGKVNGFKGGLLTNTGTLLAGQQGRYRAIALRASVNLQSGQRFRLVGIETANPARPTQPPTPKPVQTVGQFFP